MTKKEFLLGLLSKIQHPDDPTNDIILGLETLLSTSDDVTDEMVQTVEGVLTKIMQVSQHIQAQQNYEQAKELLTQMRKNESVNEDSVDQYLEEKLQLL